jgi:hypothetical protein
MATAEKNPEVAAIVPFEDKSTLQLVIDLHEAGAITPVSLELTDPEMPLDRWLNLGALFGQLHRSINWYIGDWINFGEKLYGEEASQGVDSIQERYKEAERITGLDHGTLLNVASICRKIATSRRCEPLGFWIHAEVAPLEPEEQTEWLELARESSWNRAQLRNAIREAKSPVPDPDPDADPAPAGGDGLTLAERLEHAARLVFHQAQTTDDGGVYVPADAWAQLAAALGEEK